MASRKERSARGGGSEEVGRLQGRGEVRNVKVTGEGVSI